MKVASGPALHIELAVDDGLTGREDGYNSAAKDIGRFEALVTE